MSGSETLPAFESSCFESGTTGSSLHPMSKAVTALPTSNLWLVSPFHGQRSSKGWRRPQVTKCAEAMSKRRDPSRTGRGRCAASLVREEFG